MNEEKTLKSRLTTLNEEKKNVMLRYGKGHIDTDLYDLTMGELTREISEVEGALDKEASKKSNLEKATQKATGKSRKSN